MATDFSKKVLEWYAANKRDLPWRKTTDPYKILVSELMLQQTQVDRVIPKYLAFLQQFPTAKALAQAPTSEVLKWWSGLGYNRRAINLQKAAQVIATKGWPANLDDLPGVGPYTAAAVTAFAFNKEAPVIDINIRRIYARYLHAGKNVEVDVVKQTPTGKACDWNNALMDFGSTICVANNPVCSKCPLSKSCAAFKVGNFEYVKPKPQSKFEGSKRQVRGAILRALHAGPLSPVQLKAGLGNEQLSKKHVDALNEILAEMEGEGLVKCGEKIRLP
ncbi:MAG: A/G-specific adenine glycosylase [Nanoarchaeota archaeon]